MTKSKFFLISAAIIASAMVVYVVVFKSGWKLDSGLLSSAENREILTYVPADTVFFFGGLQPASFRDATDILTPQKNWMGNIDWAKQLKEIQTNDASPAQKIFTGLYVSYMKALKNIDTAAETLGIGSEIDSVSYSIGVIPVMRMKLENPQAFTAFIDDAEKSSQAKAEKKTLGNITYRSYSFDTADTEKPSGIKFIIAQHDDYGVFTFATPLEDEQTRNKILGVEKPENSLAKTSQLTDIQSQYGFHKAYLGYINHREVMNGLTVSGGNDFGKMVDAFLLLGAKNSVADSDQSEEAKTGADPLVKVRSPECRAELMAVADNWPQTVFGYTEFDTKSSPKKFVMKGVLESKDTAFLKEISKIRGFLPASISDINSKPVFGLGVAINVDALAPFMGTFIQGIVQKDYKCPALAELKQQIAAANPAMALGMMSGMAAGVQGISAVVLDFDGSVDMTGQAPMPNIKSIDALITLSSSNPQSILMMASNFMQGMPALQLPPDGTAIDLPVPLPLPVNESPKLALKGNHLVVYIGKKAEKAANDLANQPLKANGLFALSMDFGRYMQFVAKNVENIQKTSSSADSMNQTELAALKAVGNMKGHFIESFDATDKGIEFSVKMTME